MILFTVCNMNATDCYCMVIETLTGKGIIMYNYVVNQSSMLLSPNTSLIMSSISGSSTSRHWASSSSLLLSFSPHSELISSDVYSLSEFISSGVCVCRTVGLQFSEVISSDVYVWCGKDVSAGGPLLLLQHFSFKHLHAGPHCRPLRVQPHRPF